MAHSLYLNEDVLVNLNGVVWVNSQILKGVVWVSLGWGFRSELREGWEFRTRE